MRGAAPGLDPSRLEALVSAFPSLRVAVIGDFFLDKYLEVDPALAEPSLETGKTANQVMAVRHSPGAAGTVASNLAALGVGSLRVIGFRGEDGEGWELERDLLALGADISGLSVEPGLRTPTYLKPRDRGRPGLEGEHGRYDTKNREVQPEAVHRRVIAALDAALPSVDALVVMDQVEEPGRGVVGPAVAEAIRDRVARRPGLVAWADSRRRIRDFRGLALKMNQFELAGIPDPAPGSSLPPERIPGLIATLEAESRSPVYVTVGEGGVWVGGASPFLVPGLRVEGPVDPTGAGDSFTAGAVLALAAGADRAEAALLGCLVASVTVRQLATTGVARPGELFPALEAWREQNR